MIIPLTNSTDFVRGISRLRLEMTVRRYFVRGISRLRLEMTVRRYFVRGISRLRLEMTASPSLLRGYQNRFIVGIHDETRFALVRFFDEFPLTIIDGDFVALPAV